MLNRIKCLFGHSGGPGTKVGDVIFADCWRCGTPVIRAQGGRWYTRPDHAGASGPRPVEIGPVGAEKLVRQARAEAPFLHRWRRRRARVMDSYFW